MKEQENLTVAKKMVYIYKSAQERGIECNLTYTDVRKLLRAKRCYISGMPLVDEVGEDGKVPFNHRTIDRVDSSKGYVKGNVYPCSHIANHLKNAWFEQPVGSRSAMHDMTKQDIAHVIKGLADLYLNKDKASIYW